MCTVSGEDRKFSVHQVHLSQFTSIRAHESRPGLAPRRAGVVTSPLGWVPAVTPLRSSGGADHMQGTRSGLRQGSYTDGGPALPCRPQDSLRLPEGPPGGPEGYTPASPAGLRFSQCKIHLGRTSTRRQGCWGQREWDSSSTCPPPLPTCDHWSPREPQLFTSAFKDEPQPSFEKVTGPSEESVSLRRHDLGTGEAARPHTHHFRGGHLGFLETALSLQQQRARGGF